MNLVNFAVYIGILIAVWYLNGKYNKIPVVKTMINVAVIVIGIIVVLRAVGLWDDVTGIRIPSL